MSKRIENEEQYEKCRVWTLEAAVKLEDPLLDEREREKLDLTYDRTVALMREYTSFENKEEKPTLDLSDWL